MPKPLRISPIALDAINHKVLSVAVGLIQEEGIACLLLPHDDPHGHLLVIDADTPAGQAALAEARDGQVKLVLSGQRMEGKNLVWQQPPVRVAEMQELLTRICLRMKATFAAQEASEQARREALLAARAVNVAPKIAAPPAMPEATPPAAEPPASESAPTGGEEAAPSSAAPGEAPETAAASPGPAPAEVMEEEPAGASKDEPAETASSEAPARAEPPRAASARNLFHALLAARQDKACYRISLGRHLLLVGGHDGTVASRNEEDVKALLEAPFPRLAVEATDAASYASEARELNISPLDGLIWHAGVEYSDGQLLAGHDLRQPVRLKAWPNFTRNGFRQSHFKLAAIMARQPISLKELRRLADVPQGEVVSFYNAAYAVGLIDRRAKPRDEKREQRARKRRRGLLGMLARRLGFR